MEKEIKENTKENTVASYDILQDFNKSDIDTINMCISINSPALLVGQTGLGKTSLLSALAKQKNKNLTRLSVHSGVTGDEILGKWLAKNGSTVWQDGLLIQAMKKGDWIVFDEINACPADVLFALHSLLDDDKKVTLIEKDGEVIIPHKDFRFFATMNPIEDYAGTKELNMAFFSRFGAIVEINPFSNDIEVSILERKGINKAFAISLVKIASSLRDYKNKDDIIFFCGTRDLIHAGKLVSPTVSEVQAITYGILNKMSKEDKAFVISKNLHLEVKDPKIEKLEQELKKEMNDRTLAINAQLVLESEKNQLMAKVAKLESDLASNIGGSKINANTKKALELLGIAN